MTEIDYDLFITQLFAKAEKSGVPLGGTFELTSRCTLSCKMCYIHSGCSEKPEKSTAWWISLAEKAKERGMLLLLLTGGEPMIRRDFEEIYLACRQMGLLISVNTNATLIDSEKIRFFAENPPHRLNITLYGASKETYSELCGNANAFEKTVSAIKGLKEAGVPVKLNFSMTSLNFRDAAAVQSMAKELDLPVQPVSYMFKPAQGCAEDVRLCPEQAATEHFQWQKRLLGAEKMSEYLNLKIKKNSDIKYGEKISCRAGSTTFWVTADGKMLPCGMLNEPSADAEDFDSAWSVIRSEREKILLPAKCSNCSLRSVCDICAAVSYSETGRFNGLPDYACKKAEEYSRLCREFLEIESVRNNQNPGNNNPTIGF